ncbi:hypothetical protein SPRG_00111 [Saprolegnia parasitica CBS 223.65]|uniref:Phosphatidate phosphatase APP1 catalytic domain-containing protein n=1 Tax=Saprolegnia parasitica (strain CBS 223.65) TaxID=695850 RepID=A0A067D1A5_SAPPC|nr:hypothetical protein SPRG_00111 [Saprolegnia parasitica CBS 223.65]KDO35265.1 hypothetical protein SPRG_00111 [Saprolegnia parasitica CBS 223.65]|eukprot:XP_012193616.1 hypothetical protein SPRG_00111 [Saprolegnia parasitica CBS 223.65]
MRNQANMGPIVLVLMLLLTMFWAFVFLAFFAYAPVLCASIVGFLYVIGLYLSTESKWAWHNAQEFENRFWTVMAFLFSTALVYIQDSPFSIGRWSPSLGGVIVIAFTLGVQFLDRHVHRKALSELSRLSTPPLLRVNVSPAQAKVDIIMHCIEMIDRIYLPSTINNMINMEHVKEQEYKTYTILERAEKDELNYILGRIPLALLFYKVKDANRTLLLQLLCESRLIDLSIQSRAIVLDALMLMRISAHEKCERFVRNIITRTNGDDLSILKSTTDSKGSVHSMHKLIYHDIRDIAIRTAILNHIKNQANIQRAHMTLSTKNIGSKRKQHAWRKVLSDVDDTLYSSGGFFPAGMDTRYPRHAMYPGVLAFYRQLDLGQSGPVHWEQGRVGNLAFLSARPHVYKDKFKGFYDHYGMHTLPSMLAGSMTSGYDFMVKGDLEPMAQKKFENFCEYYSIYPEYKHVFIGDNGQGDVRAAQLIAEKFGPSVLEAAYFHLVQPIERTFGFVDKATYKKLNIIFFDTYVGAAVHACRLEQISIGGLRQICDDARAGFVAIAFKTSAARDAQREKINYDLSLANELLGTPRVPLIEKPQRFGLNTVLYTPFGKGSILSYDGITGMYTVNLTEWWLKTKDTARVYLPEASLSTTKVTKGHNDFSSSAAKPSNPSGNPLAFVKTNFVTVMDPLLLLQGVFPPDTSVQTTFGPGRVVRYRPDDIYEVHLFKHGVAHAYCHPSTISQISDVEPPLPATGFVRSSLEFFTKAFQRQFGHKPPPRYPKGSRVHTPFGQAVVLSSLPHHVYSVRLDAAALRDTVVSVQEDALSTVVSAPPRSSGLFSLLSFASATKDKPVFPKHTAVTTFFGPASVLRYRSRDATYELRFAHGVLGYFQASCVQKTKAPSSSIGLFDRFSTFVKPKASPALSTTAAPCLDPPALDLKADAPVETPFGPGRVAAPHCDGVLRVTLSDPAMSGVQAFVQTPYLTEREANTRKYSLIDTLTFFRRYYESEPDVEAPTTDARKDAFKLARASDSVQVDGDGSAFVASDADPSVHFPVHGRIGLPVSTVFGPGVLFGVRSSDGVHVISWRDGTHGYVQAKDVYGEMKAVIGDWVGTPFGKGRVRSYRRSDHVYVVALEKALKALCYVHEASVERLLIESDNIIPSSCGIM